jgi:UDP-GlcNAc:undecaprenyl-phosphate/decaprenyl-phosphate GlcNAc-1-phosphate transferase
VSRILQVPSAVNYRGVRLSVWLGVVVAAAAVVLTAVAAIAHPRLGWIIVGIVAVFLSGLYDDSRPHRTRGIRAQLAALRRGEVTPGVVKLVVIGAASAFTAWMLGARGGRFVLGAAVIAGSANLWNLLDVRPGRSLKAFLPPAVALAATAGSSSAWLFGGLAAIAAIAMPFDLRERAMLGDCGANVLGFVIGVGMLLVLPTVWLGIVLAALVVLHVLADTVTLSRLIERAPPLRWLDGLARKKFTPSD